MNPKLKWAFGILLLVLGTIALIIHKMTGAKGIGQAAITAIEAAHQPAIEAEQAKLKELKAELGAQHVDVIKAEAEVARRKDKLLDTYSTVGLSADDVADRLVRLKL